MLRSKTRLVKVEDLEARCVLSSVGWDGYGQGSADLTYYIGETPDYLDNQAVVDAIESAMDAWSDEVDVEFTRTYQPNQYDSIDIAFRRIDGAGGTLAQAYFPDDVNPARLAGDITFDTSDRWEIGNQQGGYAHDLTLVAVHEIGHSLGLEHSDGHNVMGPSVSPYEYFDGLSAHDIEDALELYAPAVAKTDTTLTPLNPRPTDGNDLSGEQRDPFVGLDEPDESERDRRTSPRSDWGNGWGRYVFPWQRTWRWFGGWQRPTQVVIVWKPNFTTFFSVGRWR